VNSTCVSEKTLYYTYYYCYNLECGSLSLVSQTRMVRRGVHCTLYYCAKVEEFVRKRNQYHPKSMGIMGIAFTIIVGIETIRQIFRNS